MEHLREFWRQIRLLVQFSAGNIFMRAATAFLLTLTLASFADEQIGKECHVAVCRWFGFWVVLASWAGAIVLQLLPRRWRRRYIPEAFVLLPIPLLAIAAMLVSTLADPIAQAIITSLLVFPLIAQIAMGVVETLQRRLGLMQTEERRRRRRRRRS